MKPLIYDPTWDRARLWKEAVTRLERAAREWKLPEFVVTDWTLHPNQRYGSGGKHYGEFRPPNHLYVNVADATAPAKVRSRNWSYPGHKTDRTCAGILAHEFGHFAMYRNMKREDQLIWINVVERSKPVTGYEPHAGEAWAESMRLFTWNPDLLRQGNPTRYYFIAKRFPPLHGLLWSEVLANAPDFILQAADKFAHPNAGRKTLIH